MISTPVTAPLAEIILVTAVDEAYAIPLAVTIRSALDCLSPNRRIKLYVLDGGLSETTKVRLLRSWNDPRLIVEWIRPNIEQLGDLPVTQHVSVLTYARLLMPSLLPTSVTRVIYIDSDMLIQRDLGELWDATPGSHPLFAVQDYAAPYFDSSAVLDRFEQRRKYIAANHPIANFRELGLPGEGKYFNGGLLVINLAEWRRKRYADDVLACLRANREHVLWWDQYALNIVFAGQWGELDQRWNQGAHLYVYPTWRESPFDRATYKKLRKEPWIIHFCSYSKPWQYFCHHPRAAEWRCYVRRTDWQKWSPNKPEQYFSKLWSFYYDPLRSEWKRHVRGVKQTIRQKYRRAA